MIMSHLRFSRVRRSVGAGKQEQIPPVSLGGDQPLRLYALGCRAARIARNKKPSWGGPTLPALVTSLGSRIRFRDPPCRGRQVGMGVGPTRHAILKLVLPSEFFKASPGLDHQVPLSAACPGSLNDLYQD